MGKKKKHTGIKVILALGVLGAGGYFGGTEFYKYYQEQQKTDVGVYKTETVRKGNVASGISESGTVTYGSLEQTFTVAEITEVTLSSSSDSSSSSSSSSSASSSSSGTDSAGGGMSTGMGDMSGMSAGGDMSMGGASGMQSSSSSSSGTETSLKVETVCVSAGQVVKAGDKILTIDQDSIDSYRKELESAVATAQLSVKQEEINLESKKATAEYTYNMYIAEGKVARETYEATLTSLAKTVSDLEEDLEEAQEEVDEYQEYVDSGYDYEEELEEAKSNYSSIEANLQIAKNDETTGALEAKQTYDNAVTNYKYADQLYEIDTNGLEDDLNDAKDVLQEAQDALNDFDSQIGDGVVYAEYSGTVTEVAYAAGDNITNEATIVTYTDPDNVTMTVSVSQDDISGILVGSEAEISLNAYPGETFSGTVNSISTSSTTGSSTVNYSVEVLFTGDISKVYSGMDGMCTFNGKNVADTLFISNKAVRMDGPQSYVMVLKEDGTLQRADIQTGYSNGSTVSVESGLEEGDTVVIESQVEG